MPPDHGCRGCYRPSCRGVGFPDSFVRTSRLANNGSALAPRADFCDTPPRRRGCGEGAATPAGDARVATAERTLASQEDARRAG